MRYILGHIHDWIYENGAVNDLDQITHILTSQLLKAASKPRKREKK